MADVEFGEGIARAFGCVGPFEKLVGGEGQSIRVGDCVFKPVDNPALYEWSSDLMDRLSIEGVRIPQPCRTTGGSYVFRGWGAYHFEVGQHICERWEEKLRVCRLFHTELNRLAPTAMPPSADIWTRAHKLAWAGTGLPSGVHPRIGGAIEALFAQYQEASRGEEIIHADLCGNVLFEEGLQPCVIDFSPATGCETYAEAILLADAVAWEAAPPEIIRLMALTEKTRQYLLRAVCFRLIVAALFDPLNVEGFFQAQREFEPVLYVITGKPL